MSSPWPATPAAAAGRSGWSPPTCRRISCGPLNPSRPSIERGSRAVDHQVHGSGRSHGRAVGGAGAVLLPKGTRAGRPPVRPHRQLIDGIRFRVRTGVPWRDVPIEYGPWNRVYDLARRWQPDGTWHRVLTRLQSLADAKGTITWDLSVDSTV
ncbi:transposase [Streptomyces goshikiensis]|uniref:transposase n=1 Tax=Streptomyces goshikiensis TaxID=1942 RepID=UPI0036DE4F22